MAAPKLAQLCLLIVVACCLLCSCTAYRNVLKDSPAVDGSIAGFWLGLWHGVISPFTFAVSLFCDDVNNTRPITTEVGTTSVYLWGVLIVFGSVGRASAEEGMQERRKGGGAGQS